MSAQNARKTTITGPDGQKISLASLPLVAYTLSCGHSDRDYAVMEGDIIFCEECGSNMRVKAILAQ